MPHKTYELDFSLEDEERMKIVNGILSDVIGFNGEEMTVEDYFIETWDVLSYKDTTLYYKEVLGYYLSKEERDLSVLSRDKMKEMNRGSKRHTTFSNMDYKSQVGLGIIDEDDYIY